MRESDRPVNHEAIKGRVSSGMCDRAGPGVGARGCVLYGSSTSGNSEGQTKSSSFSRSGASQHLYDVSSLPWFQEVLEITGNSFHDLGLRPYLI